MSGPGFRQIAEEINAPFASATEFRQRDLIQALRGKMPVF